MLKPLKDRPRIRKFSFNYTGMLGAAHTDVTFEGIGSTGYALSKR